MPAGAQRAHEAPGPQQGKGSGDHHGKILALPARHACSASAWLQNLVKEDVNAAQLAAFLVLLHAKVGLLLPTDHLGNHACWP